MCGWSSRWVAGIRAVVDSHLCSRQESGLCVNSHLGGRQESGLCTCGWSSRWVAGIRAVCG